MATINYTLNRISGLKVSRVTWTALANGDDGQPLEAPLHSDRTVQVGGTFSVGGTVVIEGTVDGTNYETLTDPQGNALSFTAKGLEAVSELVTKIRPRVTAGDGSTSLNADLVVKAP